ncbi:MAG: type II toxin-antitoxin system HicB family antitoxin [Methanosarcinales archaeon]
MGERYTIEIFYSEEDGGYIAVAPELPGCSAFGETEEEALKEIKIAIELWLEVAKKDGREVPKPVGKEVFKSIIEEKYMDLAKIGFGDVEI